MNHSEIVSFLWGVADLIRDTFKRGKYQDVILPLTVLRRLDCVLAPTKDKVLRRQGGAARQGLAGPGRAAPQGVRLRLLQHVALRLRQAPRRRAPAGGEPAQLHRRLQPEHARGARALRLRQHDQQARRVGPALQGARALQDGGPPSRRGRQPHHGHDLRGADPQVQRGAGREPRRALHAPRRRPPDGGPHAGGRRAAHPPPGRGLHRLRPLLRLRRHADDHQGARHRRAAPERRHPPVRPSTRRPRSTSSARR